MIIADTGIGMSGDQLARIFEPFAQADDSATRRTGGTGLGLSITRHFCQMMGGGIRVVSEPRRGSTFTLRIPREVVPPEDALQAAPAEWVLRTPAGVEVPDQPPANGVPG